MIEGGLIASYAGRMVLCGIFAFVGMLFSIGLTLVTHARKGLPLTTQTDRITGVREHGIFRWFLTFAAFLVGPWLLLMLALTGTHYVLILWAWLTVNWAVPLIALVIAIVVGAFVLIIRRERQDSPYAAPLPALTPTTGPAPVVAAEPVGWSMPEINGHWSER